MTISEFITKLEKFKVKHGDVKVKAEYWCADCRDTHEGPGLELDLDYNNELVISVIHIGMEDFEQDD